MSDVNKTKVLRTQIETISSKMTEIKENLNDKFNKLQNNFSEKTKTLIKKEAIVNDYIDNKINNNKLLKKNEKEKLNKDKNLLDKLDNLIKKLEESLEERTKKLSFLKVQSLIVII